MQMKDHSAPFLVAAIPNMKAREFATYYVDILATGNRISDEGVEGHGTFNENAMAFVVLNFVMAGFGRSC